MGHPMLQINKITLPFGELSYIRCAVSAFWLIKLLAVFIHNMWEKQQTSLLWLIWSGTAKVNHAMRMLTKESASTINSSEHPAAVSSNMSCSQQQNMQCAHHVMVHLHLDSCHITLLSSIACWYAVDLILPVHFSLKVAWKMRSGGSERFREDSHSLLFALQLI